ncbi:hypothetical protein ACRPK0_06550 [Limosilactobacillus reuteri]|uniref:hypothetical protein n=1 Tax=Limosilactobacillus reuteri TaxID=1598 RepID=UPI003D78010A
MVNSSNKATFILKCGLALPEKLNKAATIDEHFFRSIIKQRYNDPIKQAEYLYSIIESEGDLIG